MRAFVARGVAVVDQLDLQVHRRAPQHVGRAAAFADEALEQLHAAELDVVDPDAAMTAFEIVDERLHQGRSVVENTRTCDRAPRAAVGAEQGRHHRSVVRALP